MCLNCEKTTLPPHPVKTQRKKVWEMDAGVHCSVIGTCLTLKELKMLCRKTKVSFETRITDHDLHTSFVNAASEKTHIIKLMQKHLDQKYRQSIQQFSKAHDDKTIKALWREAVQQGDVAGAFWAISTSPLASEDLQTDIYGEVHMLSHLSGASLRMDMQEFKQLRLRLPALELALANAKKETQKHRQTQEKTTRDLDRQLETLRAKTGKLKETEQALYEFQQGSAQAQLQKQLKETNSQVTKLKMLLKSSEQKAMDWQRTAIRQQDKNLENSAQISEVVAERNALEKTVEHILEPEHSSCAHTDDRDQRPDLSGLSVMFVGGRYNQSAHFRALVERQNGRFIHHDGGLENSRMQLGKTLSQADIVICPIDCVSHNAINTVKRHCEKTTKQLILLPHSSLSAFTKGLAGVSLQ